MATLVAAPDALAVTGGRVTTIDLEPSGLRTFESRAATRFTLAGVQWRGSGTVRFRTRSRDGRWSRWRLAAPEAEDGPDPRSSEHRSTGWRLGNPWWVGDSDRIEARVTGNVTRLRAQLVWSPETRIPLRVPAATVSPPIVPRT